MGSVLVESVTVTDLLYDHLFARQLKLRAIVTDPQAGASREVAADRLGSADGRPLCEPPERLP